MNIKLRINEVINLLPQIAAEQLHKTLSPIAQTVGVVLPPVKIGHGYYLWTLDGDNWQSFTKLDATQKAIIAELYQEKINSLNKHLAGSPLQDKVITIPSEDFIFTRPNGSSYDIALTGWGYKYPNKAPIVSLDTWVKHLDKEAVRIGFKWEDDLLPHFPFTLAGENRSTQENGWFQCDGKLPVGNTYQICTLNETSFNLIVEKNKQDYVYDLTKRGTISIKVLHDGNPVENAACNIAFRNKSANVVTDSTGTANLEIVLEPGADGGAIEPQPVCTVSYNDKTQEKVANPHGVTDFVFESFTEPVVTPEPPAEPEPPIVPEPPIEPEPPVEPEPPIEPVKETVRITLLDYEGYPLVDMPFTIKTKKKGKVQLTTDNQGRCEIPKEWLTPKEKINVDFDVTPEYQTTHDIHRTKKKK